MTSAYNAESDNNTIIYNKEKNIENILKSDPALYCESGQAGSGYATLVWEIRIRVMVSVMVRVIYMVMVRV